MLKTQIMKMSELKKATYATAFAVGVALVWLYFCIFRVSNATTLVILLSAAILTVFSIISTSKLRYLLLLFLSAALLLFMFIRREGSTLFMLSVVARFAVYGLLIAFFGTLLSQVTQRMYLDMQRVASEREEALSQSRQWLARLNALVRVISAISTKNRLREIFTESLKEARKVFNADSGLIYSVNRETGKLSVVSSFGYRPEILEKMKEKGIGDISSCLACQQMGTVAVDDLATDEKCQNLARVNTGSCICLPITSGDTLWGVLHIRRRYPDAFTPEGIQLAQAMTYQFGLAMQRASLFDQINLLAITDPLTGLYNYRKLGRDLPREFVRSERYQHQFSFIMADIDHFKSFNDTYGHQAGDAVLRGVARAMEKGRREVDRVYRYGGEEFSILLPETDWPEALEVAEKIRKSVESLAVEAEDGEGPLKVSISMGVAAFPGDSGEPEGLIGAADEALYAAKESGRNRTLTYAELVIGPRERARPDKPAV